MGITTGNWMLRGWRSSAALAASTFCLCASLSAQENAPFMPMQPKFEDGAEFRWLNKSVAESRLLDGMEDLAGWSFKGDGEMTLSDVRAKDGRHSLRIQSRSNIAEVEGGGEWEDLVATRRFAGEDWSRYNRISLWVYPDISRRRRPITSRAGMWRRPPLVHSAQ